VGIFISILANVERDFVPNLVPIARTRWSQSRLQFSIRVPVLAACDWCHWFKFATFWKNYETRSSL